ncbi:MAG: hypothetical protein ACLFPX_05500 [Candidatus Omnitrophota bacterium]
MSNERGAILLEVLLAVVILAFTLTAAARSYILSLRARYQAVENARAAMVMENEFFSLFARRRTDSLPPAGAGTVRRDGEEYQADYRYPEPEWPVEDSQVLPVGIRVRKAGRSGHAVRADTAVVREARDD